MRFGEKAINQYQERKMDERKLSSSSSSSDDRKRLSSPTSVISDEDTRSSIDYSSPPLLPNRNWTAAGSIQRCSASCGGLSLGRKTATAASTGVEVQLSSVFAGAGYSSTTGKGERTQFNYGHVVHPSCGHFYPGQSWCDSNDIQQKQSIDYATKVKKLENELICIKVRNAKCFEYYWIVTEGERYVEGREFELTRYETRKTLLIWLTTWERVWTGHRSRSGNQWKKLTRWVSALIPSLFSRRQSNEYPSPK